MPSYDDIFRKFSSQNFDQIVKFGVYSKRSLALQEKKDDRLFFNFFFSYAAQRNEKLIKNVNVYVTDFACARKYIVIFNKI